MSVANQGVFRVALLFHSGLYTPGLLGALFSGLEAVLVPEVSVV
jgi:hypothetical protein